MTHRPSPSHGTGTTPFDRRVSKSIYLPHLTAADGIWLTHILPVLQRNNRPEPGSVKVEDISLRYRAGRLGIADALDATSELLEAFASAGVSVEHRNEWYIADIEDTSDEDNIPVTSFATAMKRAMLRSERAAVAHEDLVVSARLTVEARAEDVGAAAVYWAALTLTSS